MHYQSSPLWRNGHNTVDGSLMGFAHQCHTATLVRHNSSETINWSGPFYACPSSLKTWQKNSWARKFHMQNWEIVLSNLRWYFFPEILKLSSGEVPLCCVVIFFSGVSHSLSDCQQCNEADFIFFACTFKPCSTIVSLNNHTLKLPWKSKGLEEDKGQNCNENIKTKQRKLKINQVSYGNATLLCKQLHLPPHGPSLGIEIAWSPSPEMASHVEGHTIWQQHKMPWTQRTKHKTVEWNVDAGVGCNKLNWSWDNTAN